MWMSHVTEKKLVMTTHIYDSVLSLLFKRNGDEESHTTLHMNSSCQWHVVCMKKIDDNESYI